MNPSTSDTSKASKLRLDLAKRLTDTCPSTLAREIAVTGSAARGTADEHSDIEVNLWVDSLPEREAWHAWLHAAGATDIRALWEPDDTHFSWTVCRLDDIWVEVGFAPIEQFDTFVRELAGGKFAGHLRLQMGWTVQQAIPLRTEGRLDAWKAKLASYPNGLAERIIADQTSVWADPHVPGVRWGLASRGERMGLAMRFLWDMQNLLRVLFAVNHVWDRDLKWTDERSLDLPIKPRNLSARIDAMFTLTDLHAAVETKQRLIIDTLELAAQQGFDVAAALHSMRAGLTEGSKARPTR